MSSRTEADSCQGRIWPTDVRHLNTRTICCKSKYLWRLSHECEETGLNHILIVNEWWHPFIQTKELMSTGRTAWGSIALGEQRHLVCCSICGKSADRSSKTHSLAKEGHLDLPCGWVQGSGIYRLHIGYWNRNLWQKFDNNSKRGKKKRNMECAVLTCGHWCGNMFHAWLKGPQDKQGSSIWSGGWVGKRGALALQDFAFCFTWWCLQQHFSWRKIQQEGAAIRAGFSSEGNN